MALTWDITRCKFDKEWQEKNWPAIEAMIWLTMSIDIGEIKENNLDEVEYRLRMIAKTSNQEVNAVIPVLPNLVGLITNVFTTKRNEFHKKIIKNLEYDVNYEMRISKRNREEEKEKE